MRLNAKSCTIAATLGLASTAHANPVYIDCTIPATTASCVAIGTEIVVAGLILGALKDKKALFIVAAVGMHLISYPLFVAFCIYLDRIHYQITGIVTGEVLVLIFEALAYYAFAKWTKIDASMKKCAIASAVGNAVSLALGLLIFGVMMQFFVPPDPRASPPASHNQSLE